MVLHHVCEPVGAALPCRSTSADAGLLLLLCCHLQGFSRPSSPAMLSGRPGCFLTALSPPTPPHPTPPLSTTALVLRPRRPVSPALPAATIFPGARGAFQPWGGVSSEVDKNRKGHVRWHPRAPFTSPLSKKRPWVCLVLLYRLPSRAIACPWSSPRS